MPKKPEPSITPLGWVMVIFVSVLAVFLTWAVLLSPLGLVNLLNGNIP